MGPLRPAVVYTLFLIFGTGITQIEVGDGYNSNREKNNSTLCKSITYIRYVTVHEKNIQLHNAVLLCCHMIGD